MDRADLIAQLVVLKMALCPMGETREELCEHFQAELDNGEIVYLMDGDKVIAFCDFSWVQFKDGPLLHVINLVCTRPGLIWKIRGMLPRAKWVTGMRGEQFKAPRGWPNVEKAA